MYILVTSVTTDAVLTGNPPPTFLPLLSLCSIPLPPSLCPSLPLSLPPSHLLSFFPSPTLSPTLPSTLLSSTLPPLSHPPSFSLLPSLPPPGLGLTGIPVFNVNNNCSSGSTALMMAKLLVQGGYDCTLAVGE